MENIIVSTAITAVIVAYCVILVLVMRWAIKPIVDNEDEEREN